MASLNRLNKCTPKKKKTQLTARHTYTWVAAFGCAALTIQHPELKNEIARKEGKENKVENKLTEAGLPVA